MISDAFRWTARSRWLLGASLVMGLAGCSSDRATVLGARRDAILDGELDVTSRHVMLVAIGDSGLCTGTLILPNLVLTARHCASQLDDPHQIECDVDRFGPDFPPGDFTITWDDDINDGVVQDSLYGVNDVSTPADDDSVCGTDIALLRLAENVPEGEATPAAPRVDSSPELEEEFDVVGYGLTDPEGDSAGTRFRAEGFSVGCVGASCSGTGATETEWAAYSPVCQGDSGGPAFDASGRVIGVVSRGAPDCTVAAYSDVAAWKDLITDAATDAAEEGGYEPPSWVTGTSGGSAGAGGSSGAGVGGATGGESATGGVSAASGGSMSRGGSGAGGSSGAGNLSGGASGAGTGGASSSSGGSAQSGGTAGVQGGSTAQSGSSGNASGGMLGDPDVPDSLGAPCSDGCGNGYLCYAANGVPPGICVPACSAANECPAGYACSSDLGVCAPEESMPEEGRRASLGESEGCSYGPDSPGRGRPWAIVLAGALLAGVSARRRLLRGIDS